MHQVAPLKLDSGPPRIKVREVMERETRYRIVEKRDPDRYRRLAAERQRLTEERFSIYQQLAGISVPAREDGKGPEKDI